MQTTTRQIPIIYIFQNINILKIFIVVALKNKNMEKLIGIAISISGHFSDPTPQKQCEQIFKFFTQISKQPISHYPEVGKAGTIYSLKINEDSAEIYTLNDQFAWDNKIAVIEYSTYFPQYIFDIGDVVSDKDSNYFGKIKSIELTEDYGVVYNVVNGDMNVQYSYCHSSHRLRKL